MNRIKIFLRLIFVISFVLFLPSCSDSTNKKIDKSSLYAFSHYGKTFSDLNDVQLQAAKSIGVDVIASREEAEHMSRKLKEIESNDYYELDKLTHSIPFLVPKAKKVLNQIGENFRDSLESKNIPICSLIVTSVLRTQEDVKKLRTKNSNSSLNSAHMYGTTFDISYVRYKEIKKNGWFSSEKTTMEMDKALLKSVLAQVLYDLRKEDLCYVRYEVKQGCFHITAR